MSKICRFFSTLLCKTGVNLKASSDAAHRCSNASPWSFAGFLAVLFCGIRVTAGHFNGWRIGFGAEPFLAKLLPSPLPSPWSNRGDMVDDVEPNSFALLFVEPSESRCAFTSASTTVSVASRTGPPFAGRRGCRGPDDMCSPCTVSGGCSNKKYKS